MPAFFFMNRPKSAGRKVFPGTGVGSANTGGVHTQQTSASEHETATRRAAHATVMHCLANSTRPTPGANERPLSAGGNIRYSVPPPPPHSAPMPSPGEGSGKAPVTTTPEAAMFLRYKRPKSAAPVRPNTTVPTGGPFTVRPKSAHHKNRPQVTVPHYHAHAHPNPYHNPPQPQQQQQPQHHHHHPPHPHHHQAPPQQQHGPTTTGPPVSGSFPYRSHHHVRPDPPPPPGGVAVRRIAFHGSGPVGTPMGAATTTTTTTTTTPGGSCGPVSVAAVAARRREDYGITASGGSAGLGSGGSSSTSNNKGQAPHVNVRPHQHMAWMATGPTGSGGSGLRIAGQQGGMTSASSPAIKHDASGGSSSSSRPVRGGKEEGASHVRNYDLMIPLNKENTTQSGSSSSQRGGGGGGDYSDAGSNGFPSQTTAELESRHILRQLRTRVSMLETGGGVPQALTPASEAFCSPRQRLYLQQIMLCKMLSWKSTTDFYTFGQLLGQGSFAKVRVALHKLTGQQVAIKTYEKAKLKDSKHWRRVQQEIRLMEKLNHSRVIRLFETIESPKRIHIVMEYLSGSNLCNYVKAKRKLDEEEARVIFSQILESLEYIHALNIVHRDIKLENVLFDEFHRAKLVDFGFSVICKDKRLHVFCGTPSYMAPEIVKRKDYMGKPVDLWSAGVVLYALLCGRFPFSAKSYPDLYKKVARGVFVIPDELSLAAKDLIRNLLVVDPEKRYTLSQARAHPWLAGVPRSSASVTEAPRFLISTNPQDDLDREVIARMEKFGVSRDLLVSCILHKQRNSITTTYYLLRHAMGCSKGGVGSKAAVMLADESGMLAGANNNHHHVFHMINNKMMMMGGEGGVPSRRGGVATAAMGGGR